MNNVIENRYAKTVSAVICTILFSATCVLSAVGPAQAGTGNTNHQAPVVRPLA
jgi:hypothetical protein